MRFAVIIFSLTCLVLTSTGSAKAQTGDQSLDLFAAQTGEVADMIAAADGTLYVSDRRAGRVLALMDRDRDGRLDMRRHLVQGFDAPSGLALLGEHLFVADRQALWRIERKTGHKNRLASLRRAGIGDAPVSLIVDPGSGHVILALPPNALGKARLVRVDMSTGEADVLATGPGPVTALARHESGDIWLAGPGRIGAVRGESFSLPETALFVSALTIGDFLLPISEQDDRLIVAVGRMPGEIRPGVSTGLYAVPTRLGGVSGPPEPYWQGESLPDPVALVADERGLFVATTRGQIWRIYDAPPPRAQTPTLAPKPPLTPGLPKAEMFPQGSGLTEGSRLREGSRLKIGSTLPEPDENSGSEENMPHNATRQKGENARDE